MDWKREFANSITTLDELKKAIDLTPQEEAWFNQETPKGLPFRIPPLFLEKIIENRDNPNYPLRLESIPNIAESHELDYESRDPLFESQFSPIPGMVHRYPSRILIYGGTQCALYCRHCFRRHLSGDEKEKDIYEHLDELREWLMNHPEVEEILISGRDPLLISDEKIEKLLSKIQNAGRRRTIRMCSRIPITLPSRITPALLSILEAAKPLWFVTHINHPDEISVPARVALEQITGGGIPILNQTVLLRGINDNIETLKTLMNELVANRIKPYYIFQGDLATGTSHLRVPLERGLSLMKELRTQISGLAMPTYAVDLPNGGGKIPLTENHSIAENEKEFIFQSKGKKFYYPKER